MIERFSAAVVMLAISAGLPVMAAEPEASHATRNYHLVFHTTLAGETEKMAMTVTEGDFGMKVGDPDISISGILDVTEDFMYRLDYQFSHMIDGDGGDGERTSGYYQRSGRVILEPGKTVEVISAPNVKLGIELKKAD